VVKKKLVEVVALDLSNGVKTVIVTQKAKSARTILLFIFLSLSLAIATAAAQRQHNDVQVTSRRRSERSLLADLEPMDFDISAEHMLTSIPSQKRKTTSNKQS